MTRLAELLNERFGEPLPRTEQQPSLSRTSPFHRPSLLERMEIPDSATSSRTPPTAPRHLPSSPRSSGMSGLYSFIDNYWRREQDREVEDQFERTIRESEAHSQRVADFLAESGSSHSSFSTLQGALDERHVDDRTRPRRGNRASNRPQPSSVPRQVRMTPRLPSASSQPATTSSQWVHWDPLPMDPLPSDHSGLSHPNSTTSQSRPNDLYNPYYLDEVSQFPVAPPSPQRTRTRAESYLEASRERSLGLSSLRLRARASERTPTPPPSPPSTRPLSTEPSFSYRDELEDLRNVRRAPPRRALFHQSPSTFAPRTPMDDAMLQSFTEPIQPPNYPSSPVLPSPPLPEEPHSGPPQSRQYGSFDLDAYREGPFRATLARSMALQGQNTSAREHRPPDRMRPREPSLRREYFLSLSDSEDDDDSLFLAGRANQRIQRNTRRRAARSLAPPPQADLPVTPPVQPASNDVAQGPYGPRRLEEMHDVVYTSARGALRPSQVLNEFEILHDLNLEYRHFEHGRTAGPLHESRDNETSARSSGLDRAEQRRDILRRMSVRRTIGLDLSSPTSAPSLASRLTGTANDGPSPTSARQRAAARLNAHRPPSPHRNPLSMEGRPEQRAPLNGRFGRARGFASHIPPDMVWVDFPSGRLPPYNRRRNPGDYMVGDHVHPGNSPLTH